MYLPDWAAAEGATAMTARTLTVATRHGTRIANPPGTEQRAYCSVTVTELASGDKDQSPPATKLSTRRSCRPESSRRRPQRRSTTFSDLDPWLESCYAEAGMIWLRILVCALWLTIGLTAVSLQAQSACPDPPPYELLRQDENYSYLRDKACRQDRWDSLKYVSLGSSGDEFLTTGGEIRSWYQGFRNASWGIGPQDGNGYLLQRQTMYGDFHLNDRFRVFAQLMSAIEAGRNGGPRPVIDESKLFFVEAFVEITLAKNEQSSLVLRPGREEFYFGSGRLVDPREGLNVPETFDGVALIWKTPSWNMTGFVTKPVLNGTGFFDAPPEPGTTFWGAYAVRPSPKVAGGHMDLYYFGLNEQDAEFERGTAHQVRHTFGVRFWREPGGWDYNSESILQVGTFGSSGLRAWGTSQDAGYTFRSARFQPRVGVRAGASSGDSGDPESPLGTFSPLFPTGIYFGQGAINLQGPSNQIHVDPRVTLQPAEDRKRGVKVL